MTPTEPHRHEYELSAAGRDHETTGNPRTEYRAWLRANGYKEADREVVSQ